MKACTKCGVTKSHHWYSGPICASCYNKNRYILNKEKILKSQNPQKKRDNAKTRYKIKRTEILASSKLYYQANRECLLLKRKQYYKENKEQIIHRQTFREFERVKTDVQFLLRKRIRTRLRVAMKNNYKTGLALKFLGCSLENLKAYLEVLFLPGMTWANYGAWEIDHIKPLSQFNLLDESNLKVVCHYTNLQPLWKVDHYIKSQKDRGKNESIS